MSWTEREWAQQKRCAQPIIPKRRPAQPPPAQATSQLLTALIVACAVGFSPVFISYPISDEFEWSWWCALTLPIAFLMFIAIACSESADKWEDVTIYSDGYRWNGQKLSWGFPKILMVCVFFIGIWIIPICYSVYSTKENDLQYQRMENRKVEIKQKAQKICDLPNTKNNFNIKYDLLIEIREIRQGEHFCKDISLDLEQDLNEIEPNWFNRDHSNWFNYEN